MILEDLDSQQVAIGRYNKGKRYVKPLLAPLKSIIAEPSVKVLADSNILRGSKRYDQHYTTRDSSLQSNRKLLAHDGSNFNSLMHIHQPRLAANLVSQSLNFDDKTTSKMKNLNISMLTNEDMMRSLDSEAWRP